jgi:hypothetical protein
VQREKGGKEEEQNIGRTFLQNLESDINSKVTPFHFFNLRKIKTSKISLPISFWLFPLVNCSCSRISVFGPDGEKSRQL